MRMSEVFKLPIEGGNLTHIFHGGQITDFDFYEKKEGKEGNYRMQPSVEKAKAMAEAVNNYDSMAERLKVVESQVAVLKAALKPFADSYVDGHNIGIEDTEMVVFHKPDMDCHPDTLTFAAFRAAHQALSDTGGDK